MPAFGAATATTFLLGAALFGALIVLPLYYQVARAEDALTAGLLIAPQGVGAAFAMPLAGRLTDRVGGGVVAFFGLIVMTLATVPFGFVSGHTSYWLLGGILLLRGVGLGATMMPAMAAAYATLDNAAVPRATSALNAVQRVGGSVGSALMAVVLQHQMAKRLPGGRRGRGRAPLDGGAAHAGDRRRALQGFRDHLLVGDRPVRRGADPDRDPRADAALRTKGGAAATRGRLARRTTRPWR